MMLSHVNVLFFLTMASLCLQLCAAIHLFDKASSTQLRNIQHSNIGVEKFRILGKSSSAMYSSQKKPAFCNGLDCPNFNVINTTSNYEERVYEESHWVTTEMMNIDYDQATRPMFMRLFDYISGNNVKKEKIDMTAPVINRIIPGQGPACKNHFTMSFYMSSSVKSPPQPSDKNVYLSSLPQQKVFVAQYGGFSSKSEMLKQAHDLATALQRDGKRFNELFFYTAGYDSPFKILNRHNEIWYFAL